MTNLSIALVSGLLLGGTFSLLSVGFVLVYRGTQTFNLSFGQVMLLGAFLVGRWEQDSGLPSLLAISASLAVVILIYVAFYKGVLRRIIGLPVFAQFMATIGLAIVLDGIIAMTLGSHLFSIKIAGVPTGTIRLLGTRVSAESVTLAMFSILLSVAVALFLRYTVLGRQIRVTGQDPLLAAQSGIPIHRAQTLTWVLAAILAGIAGIIYGANTSVTPDIENLALLALPAVMLGGLDSVDGAVLGGIIIGLLQGLITVYWNAKVVDPVTYGLLLVVVLVRPSGLLGTRMISRT